MKWWTRGILSRWKRSRIVENLVWLNLHICIETARHRDKDERMKYEKANDDEPHSTWSNLHLPIPTSASSMSSSSVIHGEAAEWGEGGITLGEGAGLLTIWTLTDGLDGKRAGGGGGGGGGGGVFLLTGADWRLIALSGIVAMATLATSLGVEKSSNNSLTSCELGTVVPALFEETSIGEFEPEGVKEVAATTTLSIGFLPSSILLLYLLRAASAGFVLKLRLSDVVTVPTLGLLVTPLGVG